MTNNTHHPPWSRDSQMGEEELQSFRGTGTTDWQIQTIVMSLF